MDAEFAYKMEIVPGMVAEVDCNRHRLGGKLSEQDLKGFGYTYYDFASDGNIASTMMACPDNTKTKQFVTAPSEIVRYNSRLPLIVYAPEKFDVKFKVWEAKEMRNAIVQ